jgi:peptidoglycan/LPS O-acetylase OafA/YrhL
MTELGGPSAGAQKSKRLAKFDGLRGICALLVVITHVAFSTGVVLGSESGPPQKGIWSIMAVGLEVGLGPFFVLSGMFLYKPFARYTLQGRSKPSLKPYFVRRVARILPGYYLLTGFCLLFLNFTSIDSVWYVLRPLLLMQDYDYLWYAGMDPSWTVPTEMQFYLVLPLIALLMHRMAARVTDPAAKVRRMMIPLGVMVLAGWAFTAYKHSPHLGPFPPEFWWPFSYLALFALGMGLAILSVRAEQEPAATSGLYRLAARKPGLFWSAALVTYAVVCSAPMGNAGTWDYGTPQSAVIQHILFFVFAFLIMVPLVAPGAKTPLVDKALSNGPIRFLGRISYGIYLWHFVMMYLWFQSGSIFGAPPQPAGMLLDKAGFWELLTVVVLGTTVIATASYYLLERPLLRVADRIVAKRWPTRGTTSVGEPTPQAPKKEAERQTASV